MDVAEALDVPQQFVSRVELGKRQLDVVELLDFAELYGKPITYFVEAE